MTRHLLYTLNRRFHHNDKGYAIVNVWRRAIEAIESEYAATIEIQDRDEFDVACQMGWMTPDDAEIASTTASALEHVLRQRTSPLGDEGWHKQDALKKQGEAVF